MSDRDRVRAIVRITADGFTIHHFRVEHEAEDGTTYRYRLSFNEIRGEPLISDEAAQTLAVSFARQTNEPIAVVLDAIQKARRGNHTPFNDLLRQNDLGYLCDELPALRLDSVSRYLQKALFHAPDIH